MAVRFPSDADGLTRNGSFLDPTQDRTRMGWARFDIAISDPQGYTWWELGNPDLSADYLFLGVLPPSAFGGVDPGLDLFAEVSIGGVFADTDPSVTSALVWVHVTERYKASTHETTLLVNAVQVGAPVVHNLGTLSLTTGETVGPCGHGNLGGVCAAYLRTWQAWLSDMEVAAEMAASVAVRTANLLADTPLDSTADLTDASGHGRGWTVAGTPSTTTGPNPPNRTCTTAIDVSGGLPYHDVLQTQMAGADPSVTPSCSGSANAVWWRLTNAGVEQALVTVDTRPSSYFTGLSVWTGSCGALVPLQCDADPIAGGLGAMLTFAALPGRTYQILIVDFAGPGGGTLDLTITSLVVPNDTITVASDNGSPTNFGACTVAYDHLTGAVTGRDLGNNNSGVPSGIYVVPTTREVILMHAAAQGGFTIAYPRLGWQGSRFTDGSLVPNFPNTATYWNLVDPQITVDAGVRSGHLYAGWTGIRPGGGSVIGSVLQRIDWRAGAIVQTWTDFSPAALAVNGQLQAGCTSLEETKYSYGVLSSNSLHAESKHLLAYSFATGDEVVWATLPGDANWCLPSTRCHLKRGAGGVMAIASGHFAEDFSVDGWRLLIYRPDGSLTQDISLTAAFANGPLCYGFALDGQSVWVIGDTGVFDTDEVILANRYAVADGALLQSLPMPGYGGDTLNYIDVAVTDAPIISRPREAIRFVRVFPHLSDQQFTVFCSRLEFECQRGVGTIEGQGENPQALLSVSRDGGMTFGPERMLTMGKIGEYLTRCYTTQLGRSRDFVFKLVVTDPVLVAFMACLVDLDGGTS